jgi:predicted ATPase
MARLDRLARGKEVAQLAATIGREFSYELLQAVSLLPESTVQVGLNQLVAAELVQQRRDLSQATYLFKHALIQDTAYESLLKSKRREYHQQIAHVLEERFPETKEAQPELLARHYTEAGLVAQAIPYWQQAGHRATQSSANVEAIAHLSKGLELLNTLPDTPERAQQELALQIALGAPLMATKGYGATEVGRAYARARELCQLTGETSHLFPILRGLWEFYQLRTEYQTAQELAEQLLALAQRQADPALLLLAHNVLGDTLLTLGEFRGARDHLERAEALYDVRQHRSHAFLYGYDSGMHCLSYTAWVLWLLGYPEQALKKSHAALSLARDLSHSFSVVGALHLASTLHQLRREASATQECAETAITLCTEQGFALFLAGASKYRGWALAEQGQGKEGIAQIHQGLADWRATGTEMQRPHFLALLAEAYGKVGEAEEGLSKLSEALTLVNRTGERWYEAELYRLKGELTLQRATGNGQQGRVTDP